MKRQTFRRLANGHFSIIINRQRLTIDELLQGAVVKMPPQFGTFKQAQKVDKQAEAEQAELGFG
jgi:hypothetical protein